MTKKSKKEIEEWRAEHMSKGLCRYCNRPAAEGKKLCQYHADYYKWYRVFVTKRRKHDRA